MEIEGAPSTRKRKRVAHACDQCRAMKAKCDGQQPCGSCIVHEQGCTFGRMRIHRGPLYTNKLETKVHRLEALLMSTFPDINLEDPNLEETVLTLIQSLRKTLTTPVIETGSTLDTAIQTPLKLDPGRTRLLDTMIHATGQLNIDDKGNCDYRSGFSGLAFFDRWREQCDQLLGDPSESAGLLSRSTLTQVFQTSKQVCGQAASENSEVLPSRQTARELVVVALDHACCLMRFIHRPSFDHMFDRLYDLDPEKYGEPECRFLPLLYLVLAIGVVFSKRYAETFDLARIRLEGSKYFRAGQRLVNITDCRNITTLQAVLCLIIYSHSSASISICHSYISVAVASALQMGLHRPDGCQQFSPIECETRKRVFWVLKTMDAYVTTLLGLPKAIRDEDINQEMPLEVDDEFVTDQGVLPVPVGHKSVMALANAHTTLLVIMTKVLRLIYNPVNEPNGANGSCQVEYARVVEIESDLNKWLQRLSNGSTVTSAIPPRLQLLSKIAYAHVQMILYRPFLHHLINGSSDRVVDTKSYACGLACLEAAKQALYLLEEMDAGDMLTGPYWFTIYTTFSAVVLLLLFVARNPYDSTAEESFVIAESGQRILARLGVRSTMAEQYANSLTPVFDKVSSRLWAQTTNAPSEQAQRSLTLSDARNEDLGADAVHMQPSLHPMPWPMQQAEYATIEDVPVPAVYPTQSYLQDQYPLPSELGISTAEQEQPPQETPFQDPNAMVHASIDNLYCPSDSSMLPTMFMEDGLLCGPSIPPFETTCANSPDLALGPDILCFGGRSTLNNSRHCQRPMSSDGLTPAYHQEELNVEMKVLGPEQPSTVTSVSDPAPEYSS